MRVTRKFIQRGVVAATIMAAVCLLLVPASAVAGDDTSITANVPLVTFDVSASNIGYYSATISWKTNGLADSLVEYGTTTAYGYIVYNPTLVSEHSITLTGLSSSTTYHDRVKSVTADGIQAISDD